MVWSESVEKSAQIKHCLHIKTVQNSSKQIYVWILIWETTGDRIFNWRKRYYGLWTHILAGNNSLKLKTSWWICSLWIIVMFLSAVWTLILTAPIHCRGSIAEQVMECYISTNLFLWRNKLIYILDRSWISKFSFWVNYSCKVLN